MRPLVLLAALVACNGKPADTGPLDADGDGWDETVDCDDGDPAIHPEADEHCDGIDNDCDRRVDEGDAVEAQSWFADTDHDGHGDPEKPATACGQPDGHVDVADDCDDDDEERFPGNEEVCDGKDNDCDELVDDDDEVARPFTWYADTDADGYGDPAGATKQQCAQPDGFSLNKRDCDDTTADVHPSHEEVCGDGLDNDCDGTANECGTRGSGTVGTFAKEVAGATAAIALGDLDGDGDVDVVTTDLSGKITIFDGLSLMDTGAPEIVSTVGVLAGNGNGTLAVGDANGDGVVDLLATRCASADLHGAAWLFPGPLYGPYAEIDAQWRVSGENPEDWFGCGAAIRPGEAPVALVGHGEDDKLYRIGADAAGVLALGSLTATKGAADSYFGFSVASDPEGRLLVGAPVNDKGGAAFLLTGDLPASVSQAGTRLWSDVDYEYVGWSVGWADLDGDGAQDALLGCPGYTGDPGDLNGGVYVQYGPVTGTVDLGSATARLEGVSADDQVGSSFSNAGDMDGDGRDDIVIGAVRHGGGVGQAYIMYGSRRAIWGRTQLTKAHLTLDGDGDSAPLGATVAGGADLDGDGFDDAIIGGGATFIVPGNGW